MVDPERSRGWGSQLTQRRALCGVFPPQRNRVCSAGTQRGRELAFLTRWVSRLAGIGHGLAWLRGHFFGNLYIDQSHLQHGHTTLVVLTGVVSGFSPWLVLQGMKRWSGLHAELRNLDHQQLLNFTLLYSATNAVLHQVLWLIIPVHEHRLWVEIWPMFVGDVLGALIMLYAFKGLLGMLKLRSKDRSF